MNDNALPHFAEISSLKAQLIAKRLIMKSVKMQKTKDKYRDQIKQLQDQISELIENAKR